MSSKTTLSPHSRTRLLAFSIAACFANVAAALPTAPQVVAGAATFNQAGNQLTVNNAANTAINWQQFSIAANEKVRFNQASASSYVINRVLSSDPSVLLGQLSSNGTVWLINRAGILVGPSAQIDVGSFVASTLNISNNNIRTGKFNFEQKTGAGSIVNQGSITTPTGGSVFLIASNVTNEGIITTPQGQAILAAGQTVQLLDTATPGVSVEIRGAVGNVTNLGNIVSEAGRIGMAGVLVRNSGTLNASSVVNEGGRVFLKASQDAYVDQAGRIVTTGTKGGSVEVLGQRVAVMDQAQIDASGQNGGGNVLVGGDYQGKNAAVQNSKMTYFGPQAVIKADAMVQGNGGKVIVWGNDTTRAYGSIFARGGQLGGNGGFVETSGKRYLDANGVRVQASAAQGAAGTWLLDPADISIISSMYGGADLDMSGVPYGPFSTSYGAATLTDSTLNYALGMGGNVSVTTSGAYGGSGDISFLPGPGGQMPSITSSSMSPATLQLNADRNINLQGAFISSAYGLTVQLNAGMTDNTGKIQVGSGQVLDLNGTSGTPLMMQVLNGKTWDNSGTVNFSGNSQIKLDDGNSHFATFNNQYGATVSLDSSNGFAFSSANDLGILQNAGVINVLQGTTFESQFTNTTMGIVNLGASTTLSLQNAQTVAGTINTGSDGALWISERHGNDAQFSHTTFTGTGSVQVYSGNDAPVANFTNVDAKTVTLSLGTGGTANITNGLSTFGYLSRDGGQFGLNYGVLGIYGGDFDVPGSDVSYTGDVGYLATGNLTLSSLSLNAPGNLLLAAGWDGTSPPTALLLNAGTGKDLTLNAVQIHSNAKMYLAAGNNVSVYGDTEFGIGMDLYAGSDMSIKANNEILLEAGSANNANPGYGAGISVHAAGKQDIAASSLSLYGGVSGHDNMVLIEASGDQTVTLSGSGVVLSMVGGGSDSTDYQNSAVIRQNAAAGVQALTFTGAGAEVELKGGAGYGMTPGTGWDNDCGAPCGGMSSENSARIESFGGSQTFSYTQSSGSLALWGGSHGNNNSAEITTRSAGLQQILGNPNIALNNGNSGGAVAWAPSLDMPGQYRWHELSNDASISADGGQTINASSISLSANNGASYGGAFITGHNQLINVTGNVSLASGSNAVNTDTGVTEPLLTEIAIIGDDKAGHQLILNTGTLTLTGGAMGAYGGAITAIGSYRQATNTQINSTGSIYMSSANAGGIRLGSLFGSGGSLGINSGGNLQLGNAWLATGAPGVGSVNLTSTGGSITQAINGYISTNILSLSAVMSNISLLGQNLAPSVNANSYGGLTYYSDASNTTISAAVANGDILVQYDPLHTGGGSIAIGALNASGNVTVDARGAILEAVPGAASIEVTAASANLSSLQGGGSNGLAISAETAVTGLLTAEVMTGATNGGIRINNIGTGLTAVTLVDNALSGSSINFNNVGNSTSSFIASLAYGGDIAIHTDGNLTMTSGDLSTTGAGSAMVGASGDLSVTNSLVTSANTDLALSAGNLLSISGNVSTSGTGTVALVAKTVNISGTVVAGDDIGVLASAVNLNSGSSLNAGHDVIFGVSTKPIGNLVATNASVSAGQDLTAYLTGDLGVNNGSSMDAGNSVYLSFSGLASTLTINEASGMNASYIHALNPNTIHLSFLNRSSGGVVIDGVQTTTTTGSSGLFVNSPMVAAAPGAGLDLAYSLASADTDATVQALITQTIANSTDTTTSNLDALSQNPALQNGGAMGSAGLTGGSTSTTGGTTDTFGGEAASGATDSASDSKKKDDKKDDENANQNDDTSGGKKQNENSSGKRMALCS